VIKIIKNEFNFLAQVTVKMGLTTTKMKEAADGVCLKEKVRSLVLCRLNLKYLFEIHRGNSK
jgi:hypothetical protein